jgi:hypothetical protein
VLLAAGSGVYLVNVRIWGEVQMIPFTGWLIMVGVVAPLPSQDGVATVLMSLTSWDTRHGQVP